MLRAIYSALFFISIFIIPHKTFGNSVTENPFQELINMPCAGFLDLFSPPKYVTDLKKEVDTLKEKLEKIEHQQKETPDYAKSLKIENGTLKAELEEIKAQQKEIMLSVNASKSELQSTKEEQTRKINDLNELERILVHYGNNQDGMNALHCAIKEGDLHAVELMLANGANIYTPCFGHTPLTRAAECNQLEIVYRLLETGVDVNHTVDQEGHYPIYFAAKSGSTALVNLLLDSGASINLISDKEKKSKYPVSPFHIACSAGNFDVIKTLLDRKARVDGFINLKEKEPTNLVLHDCTPLDLAIWKLTYKDNPENLEIIKYLVESGATRRVIHLDGHGARDYVYCPVIAKYLEELGICGY